MKMNLFTGKWITVYNFELILFLFFHHTITKFMQLKNNFFLPAQTTHKKKFKKNRVNAKVDK